MRLQLREISDSLHGKSFVMASYNRRNIIIFENNSLFILCGFTQRSGKAEYVRNVKIELSPPLPRDVLITGMTVMDNGTMLAMWGPKGVFVVRMNSDLLSLRDNYQSIKNDYFCEIYSMDKPIDFPSVKIDYASLLLAGEEQMGSSMSNTYGLFKSIVSFDFATSINGYPVVMAIDFEGEMYSSVVDFTAVISAGKLLSHIIAVPGENASYEYVFNVFNFSILCFESHAILSLINLMLILIITRLFLHDQLQLPTDAYKDIYMWDSDRDGTYLVSTHLRLYYIDILHWIRDYKNALDARFDITRFGPPLTAVIEDSLGKKIVPFQTEVERILIKKQALPTIVCNDSLSEEALLSGLQSYTAAFSKNLQLDKEALELAVKRLFTPNSHLLEELTNIYHFRVVDIQNEAAVLVEQKQVINQRLLEMQTYSIKIPQVCIAKRPNNSILIEKIILLCSISVKLMSAFPRNHSQEISCLVKRVEALDEQLSKLNLRTSEAF
uniref:CNH domain-containing protein n=1 Tax=Heterorhabditis bacteriophora TaxID=37862 RepID=A0A1I7WBX9_HETBA